MFIELVTEAAFPNENTKPNDNNTKELLHKQIAEPENIAIRAGKTPKGIETWESMPWLMPAAILWFNLLMKFEGAVEYVFGNFMQD